MHWLSVGVGIAVGAGLTLIENLPPGIGLVLVLLLVVSCQIENARVELEEQRTNTTKLAEGVTFIALVLKGEVDE